MIFSILLNIFTLAAVAFMIHKLYRIHLQQYTILSMLENMPNGALMDAYRQIEALIGIYKELDLRKALPASRGWAASPDILLALAQHCLDVKPRQIVECGSGISTVVQARCMQINGQGHVYTLEHDPDYAAETRRHLEKHGLSDYATVIVAPLCTYELRGEEWPWYSMDQLPHGPIDMVFIDGPPKKLRSLARYPALPLLTDRLSEKAVVFLDDASRPEEIEAVELWQEQFPNLLKKPAPFCEKGCIKLAICPHGA